MITYSGSETTMQKMQENKKETEWPKQLESAFQILGNSGSNYFFFL